MKIHYRVLFFALSLGMKYASAQQDSLDAEKIDTLRHRHILWTNIKNIKNSNFEFSGGFSIPAQDFKNLWFATPGRVISISMVNAHSETHFGGFIKFDCGYNGYSKSGLVNNLTNYYGYSNLSFSVNGDVSDITYQELLFGLFYAYPFKRFTILGKAFVGFMSSTYPGFIVDIVDRNTGNTGSFYENGMSGFGAALGVGLDIRYCIYQGFSTFLSADYIHSEQECTLIVGGDAISSTGTIVSDPVGQSQQYNPYDLFHFSFGLGYQFRAKK